VPLQATIESAAAEPERFRGLADIPREARHGLLDEESFDLFEAHVLDARRRIAIDPQAELTQANGRSARHQHAALDRVIQLADVPRPGVIDERLQRRLFEPREVLAIALRMLPQEMYRERGNVLAAITQRRQLDLDRVQAEEQILPEPAAADFLA